MRKPKPLLKTARSTSGLREVLFEELDKLRSGKCNPGHANAVAKVSSAIIDTARLEIDVAKILARAGEAKDVKALEWEGNASS